MAKAFATIVAVYTNAAGIPANLDQSLDSVAAFVETKDLDIGKVDFRKMIQKIYLGLEGLSVSSNAVLIIKTRDHIDDPLVSQPPVLLSTMRDNTIAVRPPQSNFFRLRIEDPSVKTLWRLANIEFFGEITGRRF